MRVAPRLGELGSMGWWEMWHKISSLVSTTLDPIFPCMFVEHPELFWFYAGCCCIACMCIRSTLVTTVVGIVDLASPSIIWRTTAKRKIWGGLVVAPDLKQCNCPLKIIFGHYRVRIPQYPWCYCHIILIFPQISLWIAIPSAPQLGNLELGVTDF